MARRAAQHARTSSSSSHDGQTPSTVPPTPDLSSLQPKPCITCGRIITPRAKWAKNWDGIKTCSDRCRSTKPGKIVALWSAPDQHAVEACDGTTLSRLMRQVEGQHGQIKVDIEDWVEACIVDEARSQSATKRRHNEAAPSDTKAKAKGNGKGKAKAKGDLLSTLDDVERTLQRETMAILRPPQAIGTDDDGAQSEETQPAAQVPSEMHSHPLWIALDSPPGLRERVRRAARRLALGLQSRPDAGEGQSAGQDAAPPLIELVQNGKVLRTLQDFSFAKGTLSIRTPSR
ncbi:uncharacterized protein PFL1_00036 [Pseudozyma flocculosa PF-1]|uniref:uncharacterized protein n=1 Tax=Pseudozyma flocculosa PF-1 TaxID=1277687 RepID=UPI0004560CDD|nr:uncharacterized protein PFL1_00036 [Pseudozyma flocculosa PF-1]EPQ31837.1 hypothetical protein PFL1_00036 [Pseudozyma flocculosa PF-1]